MSVPREGIHKWRTPGDLAAVDLIGTLIFAWIIAKPVGLTVVEAFILLVLIGIIVHLLLGIETSLIEKLRKIDYFKN
jgi:hypothetical protein